jgi:hypothetical protein
LTYTAVFRNSTQCAEKLSCITATNKRKITVKRREEEEE